MKLGVLTCLYSQEPIEEVLDRVVKCGLDGVELGTGNYPGGAHADVHALLADKGAQDKLLDAVKSRGLEISALSCHGNPLHPDPKLNEGFVSTARKTIELAEKLGVSTVVDFSGCPGADESSRLPNWVTCPWPQDFSDILAWQWEKRVIPFWKQHAKFAADHGVKVALEMHPGFVVYNPETLLRLRDAAGDNIGANLDPSHLFWQGIEPVAALRALGEAVFYVHAKDTRVDPINTAVNGVLDTKPYDDELKRSWVFRTVGYGHDVAFWNDFVSTLRMIGYDYYLSIEHEDSIMSVNEGFAKAVEFLKGVLLAEAPSEMYWA